MSHTDNAALSASRTSSTEEEDVGTLTAISLCAFSGTTVSGAVGFGGAVTFLAFAAAARSLVELPIRHAIMLSIFRSAFTNPIMLWMGWRSIDWELLALLAPGIMSGALLGQLLLRAMPASAVQQAVGIICLVVVAERLNKARKQRATRAAEPNHVELGEAASSVDSACAAVPVVEEVSDPGEPATLAARRRTLSALLTGVFCGTLGSSLGTAGLPLTIFASYHPMHKTALRSLVCAVGIFPQYIALVSFANTGELAWRRDWPSLVAVLTCATAGVRAGQCLHQALTTDVLAWAVVLFLAAVAVELLSPRLHVRLATAALLCAGALLAVCGRQRGVSSAAARGQQGDSVHQ